MKGLLKGLRLAPCALGLTALMLLAASGRAHAVPVIDEGRPLVVGLELRGVKSVDVDALRDGLATRVTRCRSILYAPLCLFTRSPVFASRAYLAPDEVRRDMLRIRLFYWKRGYRDATVTSSTSPARGGVRVRFDIAENAPTTVDTVVVTQGKPELPARTVASRMRLRPGDALDLVALDSTRMDLRNELWERGFADATVSLDTSRISNAENHGPVTIAVQPGLATTVDSIMVEGNTAIESSTVLRLMQTRPGALYRRSDLLRSQRELYLSGLFSEVDAQAIPSTDSGKTIRVVVREAPLHRFEFSGGFTTADFLQLDASFSRYHFLGGARRLTLRATAGNLFAHQLNGAGVLYDVTQGATGADREPFLRPTWAASIDFAQPWAFGPRNQLGASIFTHRRNVPGVVTDLGAGASVALTRQLGSRSEATLSYTWEASTIEASDVYFCVSIGLCVSSVINIVARRNPLAPVSLVASVDRTDDPFTPSHGVRGRVELELASPETGSSFAYQRASATGSAYRRVTRRAVLAGRVRLGWVRALPGNDRSLGVVDDSGGQVIHPRKLFFSGGSQSVRGYGENQLGPRILTIDPAKLTDTSNTALLHPCTAAQLEDGSCNPNLEGLPSSAFTPRPLGGTALLEGSVELRFPISVPLGLTGAVFVDGAIVGTQRFTDLLGATATITPGFGVRFATPVGPVRLDLGIRPQVVERLPVITQVTEADGSLRLVTLAAPRRFNAAESRGGFLGAVLSRLTLHLAIGPAF
ncbi:MAG: BamA/TamA family outer membrane protein [Gemmatimonadota bacterium]